MTSGAWDVSVTEFPDDVFLPYCDGAAYMLGRRAVERISTEFSGIPRERVVRLEDAMVGIVAKRSNISARVGWIFKPPRHIVENAVVWLVRPSNEHVIANTSRSAARQAHLLLKHYRCALIAVTARFNCACGSCRFGPNGLPMQWIRKDREYREYRD